MHGEKDRNDGLGRVLSLALPEKQWRALLEVEPEPIAWLRQQVRERLHESGPAEGSSVTGHGAEA